VTSHTQTQVVLPAEFFAGSNSFALAIKAPLSAKLSLLKAVVVESLQAKKVTRGWRVVRR
jgi:hypothetical protein